MRYNKIIENKKFKETLNKIELYEKYREFCCHNFQHFIDTARIGYILNLEENAGVEKDLIYAAALLHDIGRYREYSEGISHEKASAEIAEEILKQCSYSEAEINLIISAILSHKDNTGRNNLCEILYRADKLSRNCSNCNAKDKCCWSEEKKNKFILY